MLSFYGAFVFDALVLPYFRFRHFRFSVLWCSGALILRFFGSSVLRFFGSSVLRFSDDIELFSQHPQHVVSGIF